jgi:hypothetical protein
MKPQAASAAPAVRPPNDYLHQVLGRALPQITHELANCANGLCGYTDLLLVSTDAGRHVEYAKKLQGYSDKLRHLIDLLRSFNGPELRAAPALGNMVDNVVEFVGWLGKLHGTSLKAQLDEAVRRQSVHFSVQTLLLVALEALVRSKSSHGLTIRLHVMREPMVLTLPAAEFKLSEPEYDAQFKDALSRLQAMQWQTFVAAGVDGVDVKLTLPAAG